MAEPTVQQPVGRRLGLLVRAVPLLRRRARARVLSVQLDLQVTDADDAADVLDRVFGVLRPGDRVYLVGQPRGAEPVVDDRPFTIWA